jgi:hypothetical protein
MEDAERRDEGQSHDPGLSEAPTGAPPPAQDEETVPETDDQPAGAPETDGEDIEPEGGGASDTEETPDASGASA